MESEAPSKKRKRNNIQIKSEPNVELPILPVDHSASDFICPICFNIINEAYMTRCGHSYCHACIQKCLNSMNRCPQCNFTIENTDEIFPNFLLNELITKYNKKMDDQKKLKLDKSMNSSSFMVLDETLDLSNINSMLEKLQERKLKLEGEDEYIKNKMLSDFLKEVHIKKLREFETLKKDLDIVKNDLESVNEKIQANNDQTNENIFKSLNGDIDDQSLDNDRDIKKEEGFNSCPSTSINSSSLADRRRKIFDYYDDLETCYLSSRNSQGDIKQQGDDYGTGLDVFRDTLSKFSKISTFRPLATLNYASDIYSSSSIVSSIEFDRDGDYFAIAGVTKKIKVFEYSSVIQNYVAIHYPVSEMVCSSKISSIIWSTYHKGMLASSDYDGIVTLWDAFTAQKTRQLQEHEKRCWSIDFNKSDPKLLASGSDDTKVKLWYTNMPHSIASIDAKANVCCVKFSPTSRYHIAFGSADHCVHYYDLRNTSRPITTFKGHKKAVSYTKFLNSNEIVSASTDSQLKLWNVNQKNCLKTYQGHMNDKNFVGLATDGDYIACGSENNSLYVYYKGLSKQIMSYKFETIRGILEKEKKDIDDGTEFVSAVCWKKDSNIVVTANSQGIIKILELV